MNELASKAGSKRGWIVFAGLMILIAAIVAGIVLKQKHESGGKFGGRGFAGAERPVPVKVSNVQTKTLHIYLQALGTITSRSSVTVKPRVDGLLKSVHFQEGQTVRAGQLLASIDERPFRIALEQAQAQLMKDQALLENAKRDSQRYQDLLAKNSISRQVADTQAAQVKQYEAAVAADSAQVANAKLNLSYCRITAPISGQAGLRAVDPGNLIRSTDANGLVSLVQMTPINAIFSVAEDKLSVLQSAMRTEKKVPVRALDKAQNKLIATGHLVTLDNQIDASTGTLRAKAEFNNQDKALFPNQFVNIEIQTGIADNALVVPLAAVQHGRDGDYVFVVNQDNTVKLTPVETGVQEDDLIQVTKGLNAKDSVVVDGSARLKDGGKVKVVKP